MKRLQFILIILLIISFGLTSCSNQKKLENSKIVKVGIIDTSISPNTIKKYNLNHINDIVQENVEDDETHGATTLDIITKNVPRSEIYYSTALDSSYVGEIQNATNSIRWCMENDVDVICMCFATTNNDADLEEVVNEAISKDIVLVAACINNSPSTCYPAMYNGVISVSEGANSNASIVIKYDKDTEYESCSELTAHVAGMVATEISNGNKDVIEIIKNVQEN